MEGAAGGLEFWVLGPTEVRRDGEPVGFRGRREQALIALLAIEANRLVPTDRLIDDLWGTPRPTVPFGRSASTCRGFARPSATPVHCSSRNRRDTC